jgi:hypothetical protein
LDPRIALLAKASSNLPAAVYQADRPSVFFYKIHHYLKFSVIIGKPIKIA